jgi:YHS domain-containing protein
VLGRLLEIVVLLLVIRAVWRVVSSMVAISPRAQRSTTSSREPRPVKLMRDPVCGTYVSRDSALSDGTNYFCSVKCRDEYRSHSEVRKHG